MPLVAKATSSLSRFMRFMPIMVAKITATGIASTRKAGAERISTLAMVKLSPRVVSPPITCTALCAPLARQSRNAASARAGP